MEGGRGGHAPWTVTTQDKARRLGTGSEWSRRDAPEHTGRHLTGCGSDCDRSSFSAGSRTSRKGERFDQKQRRAGAEREGHAAIALFLEKTAFLLTECLPQLARADPKCHKCCKCLILLARETGLEPATSGVTGRRSNQLSYSPAWDRAGTAQRVAD